MCNKDSLKYGCYLLCVLVTYRYLIVYISCSSLRVLTTTLLVAGIVFVLKQWPEVRDLGSHLIRHLKQALSVK